MNRVEKDHLLELERKHSWHPFTQMREWCDPARSPLIITRGRGVWLYDIDGYGYIDGNSSIWTNVHGHGHPRIVAAIEAQLAAFAHSSFLGATHPTAITLATRLIELWSPSPLTRVFFSDDGSTAIEAALKMSLQYWQLVGEPSRTRFLAFDRAYHGDTCGVSSLGGMPEFHGRFAALHFPVRHIGSAAELGTMTPEEASEIAAVIIEPLIQGAAGMQLWPTGMLREIREWCDRTRVLMIADEVMTGFGRTGRMFACQHEGVTPDIVALAKGLTGGFLPLAATLVSETIFEAFLGEAGDGRAFLHGHSYTANALGCAAALASLDVFAEERTLEKLAPKIILMTALLDELARESAHVLDVRQCGFIAGIELCKDRARGSRHPAGMRMGARVCEAARSHGLLTRPIGDTIVLMPPLCIGEHELIQAVQAVALAIREVCQESDV
jgi:adenosylmethionine-8-amino-7-oxononanoate aminotransferase